MDTLIVRATVHHDDFEMGIRLPEDALRRFGDKAELIVTQEAGLLLPWFHMVPGVFLFYTPRQRFLNIANTYMFQMPTAGLPE
jgi:hypothetical protein